MKRKSEKEGYRNFSNVEDLKNNLIPEEFPEGSFGSSIDQEKPIDSSKSTPWRKGQRRRSAFTYSAKDLHEDLPRKTPGAHPTHDKQNDFSSDD